VRLAVRGEPVKVLVAEPCASPVAAAAGTVVGTFGDRLRVAAGDGTAFDLVRVQRPGGKPISGRDLANGLRLVPGSELAASAPRTA
jgi:methionyl-tRNA formyltransferase